MSDGAAQRVQTQKAYARLTRAVRRQLKLVASSGEPAIAWLHTEFPKLFGNNSSNTIYAEKELPRAHANSMSLAYAGNEAGLENGESEAVNLQAIMAELVRFAEFGHKPLGRHIRQIITNSLPRTADLTKDFIRYGASLRELLQNRPRNGSAVDDSTCPKARNRGPHQ